MSEPRNFSSARSLLRCISNDVKQRADLVTSDLLVWSRKGQQHREKTVSSPVAGIEKSNGLLEKLEFCSFAYPTYVSVYETLCY